MKSSFALIITLCGISCGATEIDLGSVDIPSCTGSVNRHPGEKGVASISLVVDTTPLDSELKQATLQACANKARDFIGPAEIADDPVGSTPLFRKIFTSCMNGASSPSVRGIDVYSVALRSRSNCSGPASPTYTSCPASEMQAHLEWCARDQGFNEGASCAQSVLFRTNHGALASDLMPQASFSGHTVSRVQIIDIARDLARKGEASTAVELVQCCEVHNSSAGYCLASDKKFIYDWLRK